MPRAPPAPLLLPGNHLEGGGQLLRNALTLSILTRTPIHLTHIRGNRPSGGGLKPQHVSCVAALAMLSEASIGRNPYKDMFALSRGLTEIIFRPGMAADWSRGMWGVRTGGRIAPPRAGLGDGGADGDGKEGERVVEVDIGSNGAVTLVLQAVLPVVMFGAYKYNHNYLPNRTPSTPPLISTDGIKSTATATTIYITGGTNVSFSPSIEYINQILFPTLTQHLHLPPLSLSLLRRGWAGSSELGKIKVSVGELSPGDGLRGFRIEPDREKGERVDKVCVTIVVPTEREVRLWSEVARGMVRAAGVKGWRVPPQPTGKEEGVEGVEAVVAGVAGVGIGQEDGGDGEDGEDGGEVEVEISNMSMPTLGPAGPAGGEARASGVGGANAQSYYVMVHTVSHPSGWRMGYDVLYTAQKSAKLPGLVGTLDNKRTSSSKNKKKGRNSKPNNSNNKPPTSSVWPPPDDTCTDTTCPPPGDQDDSSPELIESRLLARRLLSKALAKLATQWFQGEVLDEFLRDQLVIYQALCTGESYISGGQGEVGRLGGEEVMGGLKEEGVQWGSGSLHAQTARWIAREVGGVEWVGSGKEGCVGVGLKAGEKWEGEWEGEWEERMRRRRKERGGEGEVEDEVEVEVEEEKEKEVREGL
ncbi:EPT/RTPC-like protein [Terfezia boudieri ATCC MYA-4762]|uniref:EPT/RTPC-like protein n=1 Tax=Terfezia boudieri ATCC MYA-4762 TaxID=1051890 RepID=A0A3N4LGC4_9PEZI|nr:EPT/RTPC-like protein [Terfezia boudieri ATCC MYA-4762]